MESNIMQIKLDSFMSSCKKRKTQIIDHANSNLDKIGFYLL